MTGISEGYVGTGDGDKPVYVTRARVYRRHRVWWSLWLLKRERVDAEKEFVVGSVVEGWLELDDGTRVTLTPEEL